MCLARKREPIRGKLKAHKDWANKNFCNYVTNPLAPTTRLYPINTWENWGSRPFRPHTLGEGKKPWLESVINSPIASCIVSRSLLSQSGIWTTGRTETLDISWCASTEIINNNSFVAVVQLLSHVQLCYPMDCMQHTRLSCPPVLAPGDCLNSCLSMRWWCHPTFSPSVAPFSFCFHSFPASGSFPVRWLFTSDGQSIGVSASVSVLPLNVKGWFPLGLTGLIYMLSKRLWRIFFSITVWKHQFISAQCTLCPILISVHDYCKNNSFDYHW